MPAPAPPCVGSTASADLHGRGAATDSTEVPKDARPGKPGVLRVAVMCEQLRAGDDQGHVVPAEAE